MKRCFAIIILISLLITILPTNMIEVIAAESGMSKEMLTDRKSEELSTKSTDDEALIEKYAYDNQLRVWNAIEEHIDPEYHLNCSDYIDKLTDEQIEELKMAAENAVDEADSEYAKISLIAQYVADRIYRPTPDADADLLINSYPDAELIIREIPDDYTDSQDAYYVHKTQIGMYEGFASLTKVLLNLIGIPCIDVFSYTADSDGAHRYNIAYDAENDEWVAFDTTRMSNNFVFPVSNLWMNLGDSEFNGYDPGKEIKSKDHYMKRIHGLLDGVYNSRR